MATDSISYETFRANVLAIREEQGVTVTELAKRTELDRPNLSAMLNGRQEPRLSTIARIASALGVEAHQLLDPDFVTEARTASP